VTRQSNTRTGADAGGAAIYGCRSTKGTAQGGEGCLRANNLANGIALEVQSSGVPALFQVGTAPGTVVDQPPFATNGNGVVANLNADEVDGLDAEEIGTAGNLFARVNDDGAGDGRGRTASARTGEGVYTATFGERDISGCAFNATQVNTDEPGTISVQLTEGTNNQLTVRTFDEAEDPFIADPAAGAAADATIPNPEADGNQPEDRAFNLTVTC
ncbi:MAG: hypothetical protein M3481_05900, partial [Actinomycetota bacterium]|nr:hypothetical protein [Actinomycetota bacterium]